MDTADELCSVCSKLDFLSLFTGPRYFAGDGYGDIILIPLGTLAEITANNNCPWCRLIKHDLSGIDRLRYETVSISESPPVNISNVQVIMHPIRADHDEEMRNICKETRDQVATKLPFQFSPVEGLSEEEREEVFKWRSGLDRGNGIQLLPPDSVDPNRPLLNGYRATKLDERL